MKAYMVHDGEPNESAVLVFASSEEEARKIGYQQGYLRGDWDDVCADRHPTTDALAISGATDAYAENRPEVLREAGWHLEGDSRCCSCGLATMDGQFPLCECENCEECRCDCEVV